MKRMRLTSVVFAIAALAIGVLAGSANAKPFFTYDLSYGEGQLSEAQGFAFDSAGNLWVVERKENYVKEFNTKGELIHKISLSNPKDVRADPNGRIWVSTTAFPNNFIEFNTSGEEIGSRNLIESSGRFTFDAIGNFWIVQDRDMCIWEFSFAGSYIRDLCFESGEGPGQFSTTYGIAIDSKGNLWITDHAPNGRVQKFNQKGEYLGQVGQGYLTWPEGNPVFDSGGFLWITDTGSNRFVQFDPASAKEPLLHFGEAGKGPGQFTEPNALAFTSADTIWVLDSWRVQKWNEKPAVITEAATGVATSEATLNGSVNPHGRETTYQFEYGPDTAYGKVAPASPKSAGSGTEFVKKSEKVTGLEPGTLYHYRIKATNNQGTSYGGDKAFITGPGEWGASLTPEPAGANTAALRGVSCAGADDCSAVGYYASSWINHALAKVETAGKWSLTSAPEPSGTSTSMLYDVSCSASNACTAVGTYSKSGSAYSALAERWDGTSWTAQTPPNVSGATSTGLQGVSCSYIYTCIAVGSSVIKKEVGEEVFEETAATLAERWNGSSWSILTTPNVSGYAQSQLYDVSCLPGFLVNDCWAVGRVTGGKPEGPLAMHWNGSTWSINSPTGVTGRLNKVSCGSATSCVAVASGLVLARWNGSSWSKETVPAPADVMKYGEVAQASVKDVSCTSASACVATGEYMNTSEKQVPMALGWNGTKWTVQTAVIPNGADTFETSPLSAVSCISATTCTAAGRYSLSGQGRTLVESRR